MRFSGNFPCNFHTKITQKYSYCCPMDMCYIKRKFLACQESLKQRLTKRNQDSPQEVERRFKAYDKDIQHWKDYDYIIINENLENCYKQIENIISINKNKLSTFSQTTL